MRNIQTFAYSSVFSRTLNEDGAPVFSTALAALHAAVRSTADYALVCDVALSTTNPERILGELEFGDMIHSGLKLGGAGTFSSLFLSGHRNWFFIDPPTDCRCTSWKATPSLCYFRPKLVQEIGGIDKAYVAASAQLMDIAYRLLKAGARVTYLPDLVTEAEITQLHFDKIPLSDEFTFIYRHFGKLSALYTAFWHSILRPNSIHTWRSIMETFDFTRKGLAPQKKNQSSISSRLLNETKWRHITSISALIPTLDRYEYLPEAVRSLEQQTPSLEKIIIVDQTPPNRRRVDIYEKFGDRVKPIFLDSAGQSLARNKAIEAIESEWCLFFDDDSVAWEGMLAAHIEALERCEANVSTGVSLAPWKTRNHIPIDFRVFHLTHVLDTGNSLINRQALLDVGGLDQAFDHGSGTDSDLGTRLYLRGTEILFNPLAVRTHFKAPTGGLRTYGAWWTVKTGSFAPFPPPTQIYSIQRHCPKTAWWPQYFRFFISAKNQSSWKELLWLWLNAPWKLALALRRARALSSSINRQRSR